MPDELMIQLQSIQGVTYLIQRPDGWWMDAPQLDVLAAAAVMKEHSARLSTISAAMLPGDETEIIYHYFAGQQAYNFKVCTQHNAIPSISPVLPAADWIEREIQDLYRVEFVGHPHPERLLRPRQLAAGFFREPGGHSPRS